MSVAALAMLVALAAQDGPADDRRGYVQGTLFLNVQPAGTANHRVSPPLGGEALGLAASAGVWVTPMVAVEGEVATGARISTPQQFYYSWVEDYTTGMRDTLLTGNVRAKTAATGPLEFVAGGGLALTSLRETGIVATYPFSPNRPVERHPDQAYSDTVFTFGGGVDAPIAAGRRVAIVPMFRFRFIPRRTESQADYAGASRQSYNAGVTVRVRL
jgi:hypothetical protein